MNANITSPDLAAQPPRLAILPIGATEQHSAHLPLCTDTLVAERTAAAAAEHLGAFVLPALPYSISQMHRGSPGTFWVRNATLALVLRDLAATVRDGGFAHLLLLNGHGGNVLLPSVIQDLNMEFPDLLTFVLNTYDGAVDPAVFPSENGLSHAGDYETSLMLHLAPGLVRADSAVPNPETIPADTLRYNALPEFSSLGHTGDPSAATAEKGRRIFEYMVERTVRETTRILHEAGAHRRTRPAARPER